MSETETAAETREEHYRSVNATSNQAKDRENKEKLVFAFGLKDKKVIYVAQF